MKKMYITLGCEYSGKSTWSRESGAKVFEYDKLKKSKERNRDKAIWEWVMEEMKKEEGDVVWDYINYYSSSIEKMIEGTPEFEHWLVIMDKDIEIVMEHARKRAGNRLTEGRRETLERNIARVKELRKVIEPMFDKDKIIVISEDKKEVGLEDLLG